MAENKISQFEWEEDIIKHAETLCSSGSFDNNTLFEHFKKLCEDYKRLYSMHSKLLKLSDKHQRDLNKKNKSLKIAKRKIEILYKKIKKISMIDSLTKVYNRRALIDHFQNEIKRALRHNSKLSCTMFDIDHFKVINDTYGHQAGDYVLRTMCRIKKRITRETDIIGRYGGEEFLIIMPDTPLESARRITERLRKRIETYTFCYEEQKIKVTISAGVSNLIENRETSVKALIERADRVLYKAKESGRNKVLCWSE